MGALQVFLFYHMLAAIIASAISLLITLAILKLLLIRRPAVRHVFLFIPLIKSIGILVAGAHIANIGSVNRQSMGQKHVMFQMVIPDPLKLVPGSFDNPLKLSDGTILQAPTTTILFFVIAALAILVVRWVSYLNYRRQVEQIDQPV